MEKSRLKEKYEKEIIPELKKEFGISNVMAVPKITKIIVNSGMGIAKDDVKIIEDMAEDVAMLTGQKPVITKSTKAISNFKIKEGTPVGLKVTLRGNMMWYFLDRLIAIVLPRTKDFRGIPVNAFDSRGNYALGIKEHTVFPEVDATKVNKIHGLQVVICTNANNDEKAFSLLTKLGMPFEKKTPKFIKSNKN